MNNLNERGWVPLNIQHLGHATPHEFSKHERKKIWSPSSGESNRVLVPLEGLCLLEICTPEGRPSLVTRAPTSRDSCQRLLFGL